VANSKQLILRHDEARRIFLPGPPSELSQCRYTHKTLS
jgi:hypothetical protein